MEATNEEQMGGFENGFGDKDGEKKEETEEKMEEKKGQGRKRREKEMESSGSVAMIKCKKTDGKGWHCKRLAQSPHSLCSYHLTQLRSYRSRFDDQVSGDHRKKYAFSVDSGGSASNYYYYYSILGPWWGKRRGPVTERFTVIPKPASFLSLGLLGKSEIIPKLDIEVCLSPLNMIGPIFEVLHLLDFNSISGVKKLETADESPEITVAGNVFLDKEKEEENEELEYKAEEKESEPAGVMKCKKTDGKRWRCKRLAKPPHSLCSYHLTQLRSYRARFEDQVPGDHRKKPPFAVDCGGAASKYYYYYSILGPWWGKRRGPVNESTEWNAENDISSKDCNGKIADFETTVDGDNGEEEEEEAVAEDVEIPGNVTYKKRKKRVMKRRGRKPVKSRSLKSLL
ncbi:hypothetical protein MA16_Dca006937 [Dendrobium catenatum]|uniref:WRC domain-containing protein n=1 Tax=Dendrobium catenatum TaxID=906689 RepID=A0A2I0VWW7_9ASPA|nr:hypothetical protein MA16_Dca006937 [Dendrobium catenatum]